MMASLKLGPGQPDARNLLGVIYAEERETERASFVWRQLVHDMPDYEPARENLRLLSNQVQLPCGETAAVAPAPAAVVKAMISTRREVSADLNGPELQALPVRQP